MTEPGEERESYDLLGHNLALCPASLQMPHSLGLFTLGCSSEMEGFDGVAEEVGTILVEEEEVGGSLSGSLGLGHVASWHASG